MRGLPILVAGLLLAASAAPAQAATWRAPAELGGDLFSLNRCCLSLDARGRLVLSQYGERQYIVRFGPESKPAGRCRIPGLDARNTRYRWAANAAGAVAVAFYDGDEPKSLRVISAAAGSCFQKRATELFDGDENTLDTLDVGPAGTVVASWRKSYKGGHPRFSAGPAGGKLAPRGTVPRGKAAHGAGGAGAGLFARDRVAWTWSIFTEYVDEESPRYQRLWSAESGPGGAPVGPPKHVATQAVGNRAGLVPRLSSVLTAHDGDQVAVWVDDADSRIAVAARRRGGKYGKQRVFSLSDAIRTEPQAAINADGDVVIAWSDDREVHAIVRRRDGSFAGPQLVSTAGPNEANRPAVGIDGRGRALVAWADQVHDEFSIQEGDIMVAAASPAGAFGPPAVVSGADAQMDDDAQVRVNERGDAAVLWTRHRPDGANYRSTTTVARGRL